MTSQPEAARHTPELPPAAQLVQKVMARWTAQAISVAAKLGIADLLKDGPRPVADLAAETRTHETSLHRLLRALASEGVFTEVAPGRFALTPLAEVLRRDIPGSVRGVAIMFGESWHLDVWKDLAESVRTGDAAFPRVHGLPAWEYFAKHPDVGQVFNEAMTAFSAVTIGAVLQAYDFSGIRTLVDVGGGHGSLLAAILQMNPQMRGILYDAPPVMPGAQKLLAAARLDGRCKTLGGDFFASVPEGGDAYLMKHIIHDWPDDGCAAILRNCRRAMVPGGRVLIVDIVVEPGNTASLGKLLDLEMLVMTVGGRERTESEFRRLYEDSGFRLNRVVPTQSPVSIIEGLPV